MSAGVASGSIVAGVALAIEVESVLLGDVGWDATTGTIERPVLEAIVGWTMCAEPTQGASRWICAFRDGACSELGSERNREARLRRRSWIGVRCEWVWP